MSGVLSQCRRKIYLVDLNEKGMLLRTSSVEAAYLSGVYVILILKV
jgi:hypothetical protein